MSVLLTSKKSNCELLGDFGIIIQVTLGLLSFSTLVIKRFLEKNKRTWKVWLMDTSKQALSSGILHVLNLYMSDSATSGDHCVWYFLNFIIDTIFGMAICYFFLHLIEKCLQRYENFAFKSGDYGENADFGKWAYQLWIWIGIILAMKTIIVAFIFVFHRPLGFIGEVILIPFSWNPDVELVAVMILIPVISNGIVFWITDSFLKSDKTVEGGSEFELLGEKDEKSRVN